MAKLVHMRAIVPRPSFPPPPGRPGTRLFSDVRVHVHVRIHVYICVCVCHAQECHGIVLRNIAISGVCDLNQIMPCTWTVYVRSPV